MTDGKDLRRLAKRLNADDGPIKRAWSFGPEAPREERPTGGTIKVVYPYETITYKYDPIGNRYLRYINGSKVAQVDAADDQVVAPKNVVILRMFFGALNDGHPNKHRLEARNVGKGEAWIATNGVTVKGTWKKASVTGPTRLFGPDGEEITLTVGQTFIQVLALTYDSRSRMGRPPRPPRAPPRKVRLAAGGSRLGRGSRPDIAHPVTRRLVSTKSLSWSHQTTPLTSIAAPLRVAPATPRGYQSAHDCLTRMGAPLAR